MCTASVDLMALSQDERDLLTAVRDLQDGGERPSTKAVRDTLEKVWQGRSSGTVLSAPTPPWHGVDSLVDPLRDQGLVLMHPGIATPIRPGQPASTPGMFWLELTDEGRRALAEAD
jgi:hypothetical protein